jgi:hypothetical protein
MIIGLLKKFSSIKSHRMSIIPLIELWNGISVNKSTGIIKLIRWTCYFKEVTA